MDDADGQKVAYIRVSTVDQNAERQLDGVKFDKSFTDHASGKDNHRPQLTALYASQPQLLECPRPVLPVFQSGAEGHRRPYPLSRTQIWPQLMLKLQS